jgi:hypothetical protein
VMTVEWLSRKPEGEPGWMPYLDWIRSIRDHGTVAAKVVKIADIQDNNDPTRWALLSDVGLVERMSKRYAAALEILRS